MKHYSAWEFICIDVANAFGNDKMRFEDRVQWTQDNIHTLDDQVQQLPQKEQSMAIKSLMALRDAQRGIPSGHLVGVDGVCSGIQMLSVLSGCYEGAKATGLVDPDRRADAYSQTTDEMRKILGPDFEISRDDAKSALMKSTYGSRKVPKEIFGEGTPELEAFYQAAFTVAPGAWQLLEILRQSWRPFALSHEWKLPDGYDAVVRVMTEYSVANDNAARIEVDELDHASFTYEYAVNEGQERGLSNIANVTHSVDAYVLRSMHRRCNYDKDMVTAARSVLLSHFGNGPSADTHIKVEYYKEQYERSTVADIVILPYLDFSNVELLSAEHVSKLLNIVEGMLEYEPFELITIHDEFRAHPSNLNHVRQQYINILADIADSNLLNDLLSQLYQEPVAFEKLTTDLSKHILNSAYGLC